jgi:hypothetical protein
MLSTYFTHNTKRINQRMKGKQTALYVLLTALLSLKICEAIIPLAVDNYQTFQEYFDLGGTDIKILKSSVSLLTWNSSISALSLAISAASSSDAESTAQVGINVTSAAYCAAICEKFAVLNPPCVAFSFWHYNETLNTTNLPRTNCYPKHSIESFAVFRQTPTPFFYYRSTTRSSQKSSASLFSTPVASIIALLLANFSFSLWSHGLQ